MAAASESDLTLTTTWSRTNFRDSFKRKSRRGTAKGSSDAGSIASSNGGGNAGDRSPGGEFARQNSNDSGRRLSLRLGGRKRSKVGLGRAESESGSDGVSLRAAGAGEDSAVTTPRDGEDSNEYYTEEEDDTT